MSKKYLRVLTLSTVKYASSNLDVLNTFILHNRPVWTNFERFSVFVRHSFSDKVVNDKVFLELFKDRFLTKAQKANLNRDTQNTKITGRF